MDDLYVSKFACLLSFPLSFFVANEENAPELSLAPVISRTLQSAKATARLEQMANTTVDAVRSWLEGNVRAIA